MALVDARWLLRPLVPRFVAEPRQRRIFFRIQGWQNRHWGVFDSFQDALAYARRFHAETRFGACHEEVLRQHMILKPHDYPVLFWIERALQASGACRLVDLGGSVGASYYAYRGRLSLPDGLVWMVCELSEVVAKGRAIAQGRDAPHLYFSDDPGVLDGSSILFSAGCLQYLAVAPAPLLAALQRRPAHLVINRLPLTERRAYVTLQNTGYSISPCRVDNRQAFRDSLAALGYREVDAWKCQGYDLEVPYHPECTVPHFHGFYFCLDASAGQDEARRVPPAPAA